MVKELTKEEIIRELETKLADARNSDGFFVTVTALKGKKLAHYQCHVDFKKDDLKESLLKIGEMVGLKLSSVDCGNIIQGLKNRRTWN